MHVADRMMRFTDTHEVFLFQHPGIPRGVIEVHTGQRGGERAIPGTMEADNLLVYLQLRFSGAFNDCTQALGQGNCERCTGSEQELMRIPDSCLGVYAESQKSGQPGWSLAPARLAERE